MGRIAAPNCLQDGCNNPTWYGYCHHHQSSTPQAGNSIPGAAPQVPTTSFMNYANVSDLWQDLLGAFPDAGDLVQPETIRQEAKDTLSAAVDSEVYRRFPSLDVPDTAEREELVVQMRQQLVEDLLPEASHVTGSEARELSRSSVDQYGRSAEDSRYLAAFALSSEWECRRLMGQQYEGSYEQFVDAALPDMRDAIDMSFRRNLGHFDEVVNHVSHRGPLNPSPVAPHLVVAPAQPEPEDNVITGSVVEDTEVVNGNDIFDRTRREIAEREQAEAQLSQTPPPYPQYAPQQEQQGSMLGQLFRKGAEALKEYIDDPDGVHEAKRIKAQDERNQERARRQREADEKLERDLKVELLKQRKRRNRGHW